MMKNKINNLSTETPSTPMAVIANLEDKNIVRNINNVLGLYEMMINQKKPEEATAQYLNSGYIQHNPILSDGPIALGEAFKQFTSQQENFRVTVHRIIALDNYVWAHVNFLNMLSNDPDDTGIAAVDIYRMDDEGKAIEHWDTLQVVGTPTNSAPWMAPEFPAANTNGMF